MDSGASRLPDQQSCRRRQMVFLQKGHFDVDCMDCFGGRKRTGLGRLDREARFRYSAKTLIDQVKNRQLERGP